VEDTDPKRWLRRLHRARPQSQLLPVGQMIFSVGVVGELLRVPLNTLLAGRWSPLALVLLVNAFRLSILAGVGLYFWGRHRTRRARAVAGDRGQDP